MTIYFDENKEAYAQLDTLERWGRSLLFQCSDEDYQEYLEGKRIWQNEKLVNNPDYAAEQAAKERERVMNLSLTKADVLLALYQDQGLSPDDIKAMLKDNIPALIKFDYASSYYRGDEVVIALGTQLGYSSDEMDYLFENKTFPPKTAEEAEN